MLSRPQDVLKLIALAQALAQAGSKALNAYQVKQEKESQALMQNYQQFRAELQARKELIQEYFDHRFGERNHALDGLFARLDAAIAARDYQTLEHMALSIIALLEHNPLHDFDNFKKALQDPNFVIEL